MMMDIDFCVKLGLEKLAEEENKSPCTIKKVGGVLITGSGQVVTGFSRPATRTDNVTSDIYNNDALMDIVHAELDVLTKVINHNSTNDDTIKVVDSKMFITYSPCMNCAKNLVRLDISEYYFKYLHKEVAILFLLANNKKVFQVYANLNNTMEYRAFHEDPAMLEKIEGFKKNYRRFLTQ
jgi:deoxycytidylate deaminase